MPTKYHISGIQSSIHIFNTIKIYRHLGQIGIYIFYRKPNLKKRNIFAEGIKLYKCYEYRNR